jgi:hypothetical protein
MENTKNNRGYEDGSQQPQESNKPLILRAAEPLNLKGSRRQRRTLQIKFSKIDTKLQAADIGTKRITCIFDHAETPRK